jgi:hypothetical protein
MICWLHGSSLYLNERYPTILERSGASFEFKNCGEF